MKPQISKLNGMMQYIWDKISILKNEDPLQSCWKFDRPRFLRTLIVGQASWKTAVAKKYFPYTQFNDDSMDLTSNFLKIKIHTISSIGPYNFPTMHFRIFSSDWRSESYHLNLMSIKGSTHVLCDAVLTQKTMLSRNWSHIAITGNFGEPTMRPLFLSIIFFLFTLFYSCR